MLDLVFLVLMIIVLLKSLKGEVHELLCNIATVVGIIAALIGIVSSFFSKAGDSFGMGILNILVLLIAVVLKPVAKHFARLYQNKIDEQVRLYNEEVERVQANFNRPVARDNSYINISAEQQPASSQENPTASFVQNASGFPQGYNGAFPENQNAATASSTVLPQNADTTANFVVADNTIFPQNVNTTSNYGTSDISIPPIDLSKPLDSGAENNFGLPYDLNAPIDLDKQIDDISPDNNK